MSFGPDDFSALYARDADPWNYETSWYEARKRALTLTALTRERYARAFEPGCSIGVLTAELAARCDELLAWDTSEAALDAARGRVAAAGRDAGAVTFASGWVPAAWPGGRFELIVFSEIGYFLSRAELLEVRALIAASLAPGGELLACHWRHPIQGGELDGDGVHRLLEATPGLQPVVYHREADLAIDLWSRASDSLAQREGCYDG
ncbi:MULTISPECIES: SAM-dependent methyltransferase [Halomonadaceae]|uniref:SAM-dependent methyltransferase n=1 Tax=Modicisalibacter zincidurans TaxID=1178777 RepID=A0ABP9QYR8_9GAMM|nr:MULTISPECIES: SAM-dependent methyltransferase [Halomonas]MCD6007715.1 nodulation S family protein [Halomonas sp. IOP_31]